MDNRFFSLLSLCQRANKVVTGEELCEKAISSNKAKLIIIAGDASDNTKKKFNNKALYYKVPVFVFSDRDTLSKAIGKKNRPTLVIIDKNFSKELINSLKNV